MKDKIQKRLKPIDWLVGCETGYANGYVGVPPEHPWFNKPYDSIECDIHGGLTYAESNFPKDDADGLWWVGFDTCHYGDNSNNRNEEWCEAELENLYNQAVDAIEKEGK